jgi:predicted kinase
LERKRLLGPSSAPSGFKQGKYAPEMSRRVYARLAECAEHCLHGGFNVIVDASFLAAADRELFTSLADRMNVRCAFISCQADPSTLLHRVAMRAKSGGDPSDADQSVVKAQLRDFEPISGGPYPIIQIDTRSTDPVRSAVDSVRALR